MCIALYVLVCLLYARNNINNLSTCSTVHKYPTRNNFNIYIQWVSFVLRPGGIVTAQFLLVPSACFPSAAVNKCRSVILTLSTEYCRSDRRKACCVEYTFRRGGRKTNETHCITGMILRFIQILVKIHFYTMDNFICTT